MILLDPQAVQVVLVSKNKLFRREAREGCALPGLSPTVHLHFRRSDGWSTFAEHNASMREKGSSKK